MQKLLISFTILISLFLSTAYPTLAFTIQPPDTNAGIKVPTDATKDTLVGTILKNVITIFFAVGGIGAVIYFLWGTVDWILSGGDKEKVGNARKKMTNALIGMALLALSFVIINLVGKIIGFNPLGELKIPVLDQ